MIIGPVADLLKEFKIIIAPDRSLNQVPFAALIDEDGKCFFEKFRIRIVPSLTTLKLSPSSRQSSRIALSEESPSSVGSRCW